MSPDYFKDSPTAQDVQNELTLGQRIVATLRQAIVEFEELEEAGKVVAELQPTPLCVESRFTEAEINVGVSAGRTDAYINVLSDTGTGELCLVPAQCREVAKYLLSVADWLEHRAAATSNK